MDLGWLMGGYVRASLGGEHADDRGLWHGGDGAAKQRLKGDFMERQVELNASGSGPE